MYAENKTPEIFFKGGPFNSCTVNMFLPTFSEVIKCQQNGNPVVVHSQYQFRTKSLVAQKIGKKREKTIFLIDFCVDAG